MFHLLLTIPQSTHCKTQQSTKYKRGSACDLFNFIYLHKYKIMAPLLKSTYTSLILPIHEIHTGITGKVATTPGNVLSNQKEQNVLVSHLWGCFVQLEDFLRPSFKPCTKNNYDPYILVIFQY